MPPRPEPEACNVIARGTDTVAEHSVAGDKPTAQRQDLDNLEVLLHVEAENEIRQNELIKVKLTGNSVVRN